MKRDKEAHDDIYETSINFKFKLSRGFKLGLFYLLLIVVCLLGFKSDFNLGVLLVIMSVIAGGIVHAVIYMREREMIPGWTMDSSEKPKEPKIPKDGHPLDALEKSRFDEILKNFHGENGSS